MAKFQVRYKYGTAPTDAVDDAIIVEAAMFTTEANFVDLYSDSDLAAYGGIFLPSGRIAHRVAGRNHGFVGVLRRTRRV
jgi:hypothetical protein